MKNYYIHLKLEFFEKQSDRCMDKPLYRQGRKISIHNYMIKEMSKGEIKIKLVRYFCHVLKIFLDSIPVILKEIYKEYEDGDGYTVNAEWDIDKDLEASEKFVEKYPWFDGD